MFQKLRSHLYYKIIIPFLLLTLLVALVGAAGAFLFITGNAQERLSNQLTQSARTVGDQVVAAEQANLVFLRELAFAGPNPATGAPAVAAALARSDAAGLEQALDPYFRISVQRNLRLDRLIVFDARQQSLLDWSRVDSPDGSVSRASQPGRNLGSLWFVPEILAGNSDTQGDKYAGLLDLGDPTTRYFFTVAPVVQGDTVVGGLIAATRLDTLLEGLKSSALTAVVAVHRADTGSTFASTLLPVNGLQELDVQANLVPLIRDQEAAQQESVITTVQVNERDYQFAYAPLRIRGETVGLTSVALSSDYVSGPWAAARLPLVLLTLVMMLAIIGLGSAISRQITRPLGELVATTQAVVAGDLERRSRVQVQDEIGVLAQSFNTMTSHLLNLYGAMRLEANKRAAIVESISDGVVVCTLDGEILVTNRALRTWLGPESNPRRFSNIPLQRLPMQNPSFGADLFQLHNRVLRVAAAPVTDAAGEQAGVVCVMQDVSEAIAMDEAKTNFIATISHEMRTPLTVMGGNLDLLSLHVFGPLNDSQREAVATTRRHIDAMTRLLNSAIALAALDSGQLTLAIQPLDMRFVLRSAAHAMEPLCTEKGLSLTLELPEALPAVLADEIQVRNVVQQLLDNAYRYTATGDITLRAMVEDGMLLVEVQDSGQGISEQSQATLFTRLARGSGDHEGITSNERGLGLGLAIAQQLVILHGGRIWLAETSVAGSRFCFTLPLAQQAKHNHAETVATLA
ncbi:MAG: ATP-binding protein [Chloroflexaceae bacterium]|jgi:signal transduction histidine kinase|nr:ATP-binding protein [Chloroflexaceae bacterium]